MTAGSPALREPDQVDSPTLAAHLKITAEPAGRISAEGTVPPADARHLITTFGIMGSVVASTAGMVLALHATPRYPYVALAALALGLVAAVLIAKRGEKSGEKSGEKGKEGRAA